MQQRKPADMIMPLDNPDQETPQVWVDVWAAAAQGDGETVEDHWPDLIRTAPRNEKWYFQVFRWLKNRAKMTDDDVQNLAVILLEELHKKRDYPFMNVMVRFAVKNWPKSNKFGALSGTALIGLYGKNPWFKSVAKQLSGGMPAIVLQQFDKLVTLTPGQVWRHYELGDGIVTKFDLKSKKVYLDFPEEKDKEYTFEGLRNYLTHYPADHIIARRLIEPEALQELAAEDPKTLLHQTLKGHGNEMTQSELKDFLCGSIIDEKKWSRWWEKARIIIMMDPYLEFETSGGAYASIRLRKTPRSLEDEVNEAFFADAPTCEQRVSVVHEMMSRLNKGDKVSDELLQKIADVCAEELKKDDLPLSEKIQYTFLNDDIVKLGAKSTVPAGITPESVIAEVIDPKVLSEIDDDEYAVRAAEGLFERDPEHFDVLGCKILPFASPKLAQAIWRHLDLELDTNRIGAALQELLANPIENPDTYLWAVHALITRTWEPLIEVIPSSNLVLDLVTNMVEWNSIVEDRDNRYRKDQKAAAKKLIARVRTMLQMQGEFHGHEVHFMPLRVAMTELPQEQASFLQQSIAVCPVFNSVFLTAAKAAMEKPLEIRGPRVKAAKIEISEEPVRHWCTAAGRQKRADRLAYLENEAIPKNKIEIETARAEGDLKENAGYHAARERHGMLLDEKNLLTKELSIAQVFDPKDLSTDSVSFGTRFTAKNLNNDRDVTYTVLGRFESDVEKNIISYQTPFMSQFMGAKVGDTIKVVLVDEPETEYRILSIESAL